MYAAKLVAIVVLGNNAYFETTIVPYMEERECIQLMELSWKDKATELVCVPLFVEYNPAIGPMPGQNYIGE